MNFLSQIFPERSAHRDELDLFLDFRVHFRKGDIEHLEQKCLAEIVLVSCSPSIEQLIIRYWLKHFLPTNSIAQSLADEKRNAIGQHPLMKYILTTSHAITII